jgi:hypothetical protein
VLLALATFLLAAAGCEPGYQAGRSSAMGGYDSERKDFNVFHVWFSGNGFVSQDKASDMALLRAAELTLEHGFNYLAVVASETETGPMGKPLAQVAVACFRKEPKHVRSYETYEAETLFREIAEKYELKRHGELVEPKRGPFEPAPEAIQFRVEPWYRNEPIAVEDVEHIIMGIENLDMDGTWVGRFADLENPVETVKDFIEAARPLAAKYGANAIVVEADPVRIHGNAHFNDIEQDFIGFVADLYVVPEASLGIEWEPGDMFLGKYIIRRFRSGSKAAEAGLRLGDKVLAINGVDVLDTSRLLQQTMKSSVGETARLAVVREGQETIIEVPLVPNMLVP